MSTLPLRSFPVVVLPSTEGGYWASCPSLQGCYSQGETIDETLKNIREAIQLGLEDNDAVLTEGDPSMHMVHL